MVGVNAAMMSATTVPNSTNSSTALFDTCTIKIKYVCTISMYVLTYFAFYCIDAIDKSAQSITGHVSCGTQYHFHMETQVRMHVCRYLNIRMHR